MKDYYSILGVSVTASELEIKRVYRRLAVKYHPDKNPSPEAESLFKEINEAYDVLGDPEKKRTYDLRRQNPFQELLQEEPVVQHRDPRYRRRPPAYRPATSRNTTKELMREYLPKVIVFSWAGAVLGFLLLTDLILPTAQSTEEVKEVYPVYRSARAGGGRYHAYDVLQTTEGAKIKFYDPGARDFAIGSTIFIERTLIFSTERRVSDASHSIALAGIYGPVGIVPLVLFITSLLGLFFRFNVEFAFNFSITSAILLIISLYLIFVL